jgi:hypothetical protein
MRPIFFTALLAASTTTLALAVDLALPTDLASMPSSLQPAVESFRDAHPESGILRLGDQVARVYGNFSSGNSPAASAQAFLAAHSAELFGVNAADLAPIGPFESGDHLVQIMPDDFGNFKFTGVYYAQQVKGIPVFRGNLLVLTRNEPGFPAVLASSTLWDVAGIEEQLAGVSIGRLPDSKLWTRSALSEFRNQPEFSPANYVIWAGADRVRAEPRLAVHFFGEAGGPSDPDNHQRFEFVVDAKTGAILYQETKIYHAVTGRVTGVATTGYGADTCATEADTGLPYVQVRTGGTTAYTDVDGNYSIAAGAAGATYTTSLVGRWFTTTNNSAATLTQSTTADDGATWSPQFNTANNVDAERAQVNAYIMANKIRDMVLVANSTFPTVATQASTFQVNCNLAQTCNAYYSGNTINFYSAGGGCANTAFGDVVAHEFGHNVVEKGGSGQGAYGEGFGDIHGLLLSDIPATGVGFETCSNGIRTAQNTCQFNATSCATGSTSYGATCGSEIHSCGQLISGCVWDLRNRLAVAYPATYRTMLSRLCVNSVLLHGAIATIASDITIDFLTLDDNDSNLANGTPNYAAINDSFTLHGLPGPALRVFDFTYPNGVPSQVEPNGSTSLKVQITAYGDNPNGFTARIFSREATGTTWTITPMTALGNNTYTVNVPAGTCLATKQFYVACDTYGGTTITDPPSAPAAFYSAIEASTAQSIANLEFEASNGGWTAGSTGDTASNGIWVCADPFGTSFGTTGSKCQSENDHTAGAGVKAWITGNGTASGTSSTARTQADVDGGTTSLVTPAFDLSAASGARVSYWRWFAAWQSNGVASTGDTMVVEVSADNGVTWVNMETVSTNAGDWVQRTFTVSDYVTPSAQVRFRFRASDTGTDSTVEAGVDDFRIDTYTCNLNNPADLDNDGVVGGGDLGMMLSNWGGSGTGDLNGDGVIGGDDLGRLLAAWSN